MRKNLTSIPGTSGPPYPLPSTTQPILGVLEQFWPKKLAEQANPTASLGAEVVAGVRCGELLNLDLEGMDLGAEVGVEEQLEQLLGIAAVARAQ